jgi:hypothetical protein
MSRLRRPFVAGRVFFITNNLLRTRLRFTDADFEALAGAMPGVRTRRQCLLSAPWACGPPNVMKNTVVGKPLILNRHDRVFRESAAKHLLYIIERK